MFNAVYELAECSRDTVLIPTGQDGLKLETSLQWHTIQYNGLYAMGHAGCILADILSTRDADSIESKGKVIRCLFNANYDFTYIMRSAMLLCIADYQSILSCLTIKELFAILPDYTALQKKVSENILERYPAQDDCRGIRAFECQQRFQVLCDAAADLDAACNIVECLKTSETIRNTQERWKTAYDCFFFVLLTSSLS